MRRRIIPAALAMLAIGGSTLFGQSRDYRAERLVLDDNNGNTIVVQTPGGPITGGTLTIPDPGGSGQFLITNPAGGSQSVSGDVLPGTDDTYDLGSGASRWQDIFLSGNVSVGGQVRYVETGGGTDYVGFQAPAAVAANQIWTLPAADGTSGQALVTDGAGVLSWAAAGGLTAVTHNATLTGNGTVGTPLGINLANSNTWTANQTFGGTFLITANSRIAMTNSDNNARDLRMQEPSGTGSQYIGIRAPSVTNNGNYLLPAAVGTAGQVLTIATSNVGTFNDSATLTWTTPSGGSTVSTNATLTGDGSGGSPLGINLANSNTWTANQTFASTFLITANARIALTNSDNNARDVRWQEPSGTGSQYIGIRAPSVTNNGNYVWPAVMGTPGQVLSISAGNSVDSGTMAWVTPGGGSSSVDSTLIGNGTGGSPLGVDLTQSNVWTSVITTFTGFLESRNEPFVLTNTDNSANEIRIQEASGNGSNFVAFRADTSISTNDVWILPSTAGTTGQVLGITAVSTPSNRYYTLDWKTPAASPVFSRSDVTVTAGANNLLASSGATLIRITGFTGAAGAFTVSGISGGTDGKMVVILNQTGQNMTVNFEDVGESAGDRILNTSGGTTNTIGSGNYIMVYDGGAARWEVVLFKI